jgi:hypothetical protein
MHVGLTRRGCNSGYRTIPPHVLGARAKVHLISWLEYFGGSMGMQLHTGPVHTPILLIAIAIAL